MMTKTRKPKRHDVTFLKKGDKVRVYNAKTGKQLPGEYIVFEAWKHRVAASIPTGIGASLRKLRGNEYHPRARVLKILAGGMFDNYEFEKVCKMKQVWVPA